MVISYKKADKIDFSVWERYEKSRDIGLRNEILMAYLYIVTCNVKKMQAIAENREDIDDMTSQGVLELINCIDRYDYRRGIQFDSFASIRVRGSIIDYIRKKDWVPRDVRKKAKQLNQAYQDLQNELGRDPSNGELADKLGVTLQDISKIRCEELGFNVLAFEELLLDNDLTLMDVTEDDTVKTPDSALMEDEFRKRLSEYIDELDEKERTVISLYYYEELKLKEIAFVMGLTASRVSQIHSKALSKLREKILNYQNS
jgi:RNA polymerase sigma factor for flagellar operon FliA